MQRRASLDKLGECQLVFIGRAAIGKLPPILDNLGAAPVLTVADTPGAMQQGVALAILDMNMPGMDGLQVELAGDGREAAALAQARKFDIILMDCQMPEMDRYEATARMRMHAALQKAR